MEYRRCRHNHCEGGSGLGCFIVLLLGLIAMPIVGFFMIFSNDEDTSTYGWIMVIVGIIIWIVIGVMGA